MIAVFLLGAGAVLLLSSYLYSRNWIRFLTVRVQFSHPHVRAMEVFELTEVIENRKNMTLPVLEIGFRIPNGLHFEDAENTQVSDYTYKRDIFAVAGMERIVRRYPVTARRRGYYEVSQLTVQVPSRMYRRIYRMDDQMTGGGGLYVYPAAVDCGMLLRAVEVILGEVESARRMYEDPFVFSSIRPYTIRDPMKAINWKATAKTGELMVNTYASTAAVRVRIYLDVSADPAVPFSDSLRELGISMAASLIRELVKRQKDASLVVNFKACGVPSESQASASGASGASKPPAKDRKRNPGEMSVMPELPDLPQDCVRFSSCMSAGRMTMVEEFLTTDFDSSPAALMPFEQLLRREAEQNAFSEAGSLPGSGEEVFLFLTAFDRPSLRGSIQKLLGTRRSGILAVLSRTAEGRREEHERNLYILPVYEVR